MTVLSCEEARASLAAYHDGELTLDDQVAVEAHLEDCRPCVWEAERLKAIGEGLRAAAHALHPTMDEATRIRPRVVSRLEAERRGSFSAQIASLFEDLHLVWAALGATAATAACAAIIFSILQFASIGRADSLAGLLASIASSAAAADAPVLQPPRVSLPGGIPTVLFDPDTFPDDELFALAAVLDREGRLVDLEVLRSNDWSREDLRRMLDSAYTLRFEPARYGDSAVAVNVVWLLARTTVRGKLLS